MNHHPNLLIIGAMKASTTLLYELLGRHPEVWFPGEKEPHYFTDDNFASAAAWQAYLRLFNDCPAGKKVIGEASTGYTKLPHVGPTPRRIHMRLGRPKMIYILRDPVGRTVSNYRHSYARGFYPRGYTLAQAIEEDRIIVDSSRYARQLCAYEEEFGEGSVLVVIAEELHHDPAQVMAQVEQYLQITPMGIWDTPLEKTNSIEKLQSSAAWRRITNRLPVLGQLGRGAPTWMKSAARKWMPVRQAPPSNSRDEGRIFELIADDLHQLTQRLGSQVSRWPSVKRLTGVRHADELVETAA